MEGNENKKVALEYFQRAYEAQMSGQFPEAVQLYQRSIECCPTAEAYTFLGWTHSLQGDLDRAIEFCEKAILVDPEYGNPYNDIGAYLIEKGKIEEAIPYLQRALGASRYESYCFPHYNLGRAYEIKGMMFRAQEEYQKSLERNPKYTLAQQALEKISSTIQ
ncbi:MAG: tetratricopeptide repeat protein [Deltaproteobacteria bacterium]|nr:tetratricopeptide repeat protein [Deltaproteobacteria bacterium]